MFLTIASHVLLTPGAGATPEAALRTPAEFQRIVKWVYSWFERSFNRKQRGFGRAEIWATTRVERRVTTRVGYGCGVRPASPAAWERNPWRLFADDRVGAWHQEQKAPFGSWWLEDGRRTAGARSQPPLLPSVNCRSVPRCLLKRSRGPSPLPPDPSISSGST